MRINVIPVYLLSDVHLQAEFREIIMSIHYYKRSLRTKQGIDFSSLNERYTLNSGHAKMWYNKFGYIEKRYNELLEEMKSREYNTKSIEDKFYPLFNEIIPEELRKDWEPTKEDMIVNLGRILDKIFSKIFIEDNHDFYRLNGKCKSFLEWCMFYTEELSLSTEIVHGIILKIERKYDEI